MRISHQRILDHHGRLLAQVELDRVWGHVGPCIGIRRTDLHDLLLEGAAGIPIHLGKTVATIAQLPDSDTVHVTFDDGSTRDYTMVVGADGIRSSIRRLVFNDIPPRYVGQVCWRFLVKDTSGAKAWTAMLARDRAFLMLPVGHGELYCYADLMTRADRREVTADAVDAVNADDRNRSSGGGTSLARLLTLFVDVAEPVPTVLRRLDDVAAIHFAPIEEVNIDPCVKGRVVLIGDAAHATSPNMAEGASMALEDAVVLSETLTSHGLTSDALLAFAARRRPRVQWVQQRTHRRDRIRSLPVILRNLALRVAGPAIYRQDYQPLFDEP